MSRIDVEKIRADAEREHKAMCENCIHKVSAEDIKAIEDNARADAINEFLELYEKFCNSDIACSSVDCIGKFCPRCFRDNFMEQVKEQNNLSCFDCKHHFMSDCYLECYKHDRINDSQICDDFEKEKSNGK